MIIVVKKFILFFSVLVLFFFALAFIFYKIQPENVMWPILTTLLLFCHLIKILYNSNEKKAERFLPIGKAFFYKSRIYIAIAFCLVLSMIEIILKKDHEPWMGISVYVFYGVSLPLAWLLFYKTYYLAFRKRKIVFNKSLPFEKNLLYTDIKEVVIESNGIFFTTHDGYQTSYEEKLTEEEKNKIIRILTNHNVKVVS